VWIRYRKIAAVQKELVMKINITIKDVDEQPAIGCEVEIRGLLEKSTLSGNTYEQDIPDGTQRLEITVGPPLSSYFDNETVEINVPGVIWDNPTCKVYTSATNELTVEFFLSQMRLAPVDFMSSAERKARSRVPTGILLNDRAYNTKVPNYLELFNKFKTEDKWHEPKTINRVNRRILGDPKANAWNRLQYVSKSVDPLGSGRFRWLEYGRGQATYLIAVWLPKPYFRTPAEPGSTLDFIVFFTPHTRKKQYRLLEKGQTYPYGLNKLDNSYQPYAVVGPGYMFSNGRNLCHSLMAAEKKAILVIPMCKYGDWGPFALQNGVGIHRMLKEMAHYLHKDGLLLDDQPNIIAKQRPDRTRIKAENRNIFMESHKPIPGISKVITAGFSSNGAMEELFTGKKAQWEDVIPNQDPKIGSEWIPTTFKTKDAQNFQSVWKEIWDLDLGGNVEGREKQLREWQKAQSGRRYRMYHSTITATRWRPRNAESWMKRDKNGSYAWIPNMMVPNAMDPYKGEAEEIHQIIDTKNDAWSLVYFSNQYLASTDASGYPSFPDYEGGVHDGIMLPISFAHAALSSSLEPLK
jgi:hypothetical protein